MDAITALARIVHAAPAAKILSGGVMATVICGDPGAFVSRLQIREENFRGSTSVPKRVMLTEAGPKENGSPSASISRILSMHAAASPVRP